jgi:hypothetical protein
VSDKDASTKANLLRDLYLYPNQIALIENNYSDGIIVERKISIRTAFFFLAIILLFLISIYCYPYEKLVIPIAFGLYTLIIIVPKVYYHAIWKNKSTPEELSRYFHCEVKKPRKEQDIAFKRWLFYRQISPFSIRQIWWWTLIIGIYKALTSQVNPLYLATDFKYIDVNGINSFVEQLLTSLIIAIVAYIATNVIKELLDLREAYVKGIDSIKDKTNKLATTISSSINVMKGGSSLITFHENILKLVKTIDSTLVKLIIDLSNSLRAKIDEYVSIIQIKITHDSDNIDGRSGVALISTFEQFIQKKNTEIRDHNSIITSWTNLGEITGKLFERLLNNGGDQLEFYALQLKSPLQYISYIFGKDDDQTPEYLEWQKYLLSNIKHADTGSIYRYFASIDKIEDLKEEYRKWNVDIEEIGLKEVTSIKSETIKRELRMQIKVNINNKNHIDPDTTKISTIIRKNSDGASDQDGWKEKTIAELLNEVIHSNREPGHCFIRQFDLKDYMNLLVDYEFEDNQNGNKSNKLYDYIAFRDGKKPAEWLFCLESRYDKDLDLAYIKIFFKDDKLEAPKYEWKNCDDCKQENRSSQECKSKCMVDGNKYFNRKLKLNKLFFGSEKVISLPRREEDGKMYVSLLGEDKKALAKDNEDPAKSGTFDEVNGRKVYYLNKNIKPIIEYR